jgi:hypothetical protein
MKPTICVLNIKMAVGLPTIFLLGLEVASGGWTLVSIVEYEENVCPKWLKYGNMNRFQHRLAAIIQIRNKYFQSIKMFNCAR